MDTTDKLNKTLKEAAKAYKEKLQRLKDGIKESKESRRTQTG